MLKGIFLQVEFNPWNLNGRSSESLLHTQTYTHAYTHASHTLTNFHSNLNWFFWIHNPKLIYLDHMEILFWILWATSIFYFIAARLIYIPIINIQNFFSIESLQYLLFIVFFPSCLSDMSEVEPKCHFHLHHQPSG